MAPRNPSTQRYSAQTRRTFAPSHNNLTGRAESSFETNRSLLANSALLSTLRASLKSLFQSDRTAKDITSAVAAALLAVEPAAWDMEKFKKGELLLDDNRRLAIVRENTLTNLHRMDILPNTLEVGPHSISSRSMAVQHKGGDMVGELSWLTDGPAAGLVEARPGFGHKSINALTAKSSFGEIQKWILGNGAEKFLTNLRKYLSACGALEKMQDLGLNAIKLTEMTLNEMACAAAGSGDYLNKGNRKKAPKNPPILGPTHIPLAIHARLGRALDHNNRLGTTSQLPDGHVQWKHGLTEPGKVLEVTRGSVQLRLDGQVIAVLSQGAIIGYQAALGNTGRSRDVVIGFQGNAGVAIHDLARTIGIGSPEAARLSVAIQQTGNNIADNTDRKRPHTVRVKPLEVSSGWRAA